MKLERCCLIFACMSLVCLGIDDPALQLWLVSGIGIAQAIALLAATWETNPLDLFPLSMLLWMMQFPMTGFLKQLLNLPLGYETTLTYLGSAVVLANICQLVVAWVWKRPVWSRLAGKVPRLSFPVLSEATGLLAVLWGLSLFFRLLSFFSGYQSGFEVEAGVLGVTTNLIYMAISFLSLFPIVFFCAVMGRNGPRDRVSGYAIVLIEVVFITLFSGSKAGPTITLINFFIAYHYVVHPIKAVKIWALFAVMAVIVMPFYAVKSYARTYMLLNYELSRERPKLGPQEYIDMYVNAIDILADANLAEIAEDTATAVVSRVDALTVLAATIAHYDAQNEYDTEMYLSLWVKPYIPRFLWPEKGWVGLGLFVSNVILGISGYTHAAVTGTIEGYIGGGPLGAFLLAILQGAFVAFGVAYLTEPRGGAAPTFTRAYFASMFLAFLYFNSSFSFLRTVATNLLALWVLVKLFSLVSPRSGRVAPLRSSPGAVG